MKHVEAKELGLDEGRLARLSAAIKADVARELYDGAAVVVGRGGHVALHQAIGFSDRERGRTAHLDDVFHIFSVTKTLTGACVLARIDRGELALTTRVADVIPEFGIKGKHRITVGQLMSHTGGMPAGLPPMPADQIGNLAAVVAAMSNHGLDFMPGEAVSYSAIVAHAILAEIVRRVDGAHRSFREIMEEEVIRPLKMKDTSLGMRRDLAKRRVPIVVRDRSPGLFAPEMLEAMNELITEEAEIPAGGGVSTAADIFRFSEMLRRGGELDGARVLSPAIIKLATTNHTGGMPNNLWTYARELHGWDEFPAYLGLSFMLRGEGIFPAPFGTMASAGTFGGLGAGSAMFWVDPERDLSFVFLSAGLLEESANMHRFQRLSDLVLASVVK